MATLLYLLMRPLWRKQKQKKVAHRQYPYHDADEENYINNDFSDYFFLEEKQYEEKHQHIKGKKDEQGRDGGDTKHDAEDDYEIIEGNSLEVSVRVDLGRKKHIPAEQTHQPSLVPRPISEEIRNSGGGTTVTSKTTIKDTEILKEWVKVSHRVSS